MLLLIKHSILRIGLASAGITIAACSVAPPNTAAVAPNAAPTAEASPVQAVSPSSTAQGFKQATVTEGLERPWGMAWLPDGSMLISEKAGRLRLLKNGVLEPTPIAGVPSVMSSGQGGLMDVSIHPRFAENRFVYLTYASGIADANRTRIARARFDGKALQDLRLIFEVSQVKSGTQHFGSRILWLPDGTMLVAIGDGGNPPVQLAGEDRKSAAPGT